MDSAPPRSPFGKAFFHPVVDALLVCGGLSLPVILAFHALGPAYALGAEGTILIYIAFNYAHFASSTVRLYTKPGEVARHRFLAFGFPLVMLAAVLASLAAPEWLGRNFTALFLTWSPFHYAAQAFGISMLYAFRSGMALTALEKRWLWWACMLPFVAALLNFKDTSMAEVMGVRGVQWLLPAGVLEQAGGVIALIRWTLIPLAFLLPVWFVVRGRLPWLAALLILINGLWLIGLPFVTAALWVTVGHSLQYLCLVTYVHAKDYGGQPDARWSPTFYFATFYLASAMLGVGLFFGLPYVISASGEWAGRRIGFMEATWMVTVGINLHHFVVDGFIWRSKRRPPAQESAWRKRTASPLVLAK